jgi:hypothetical protein
MNRNTRAAAIEARLHRSLQNQVRVPQLDRSFDAGVWARIEAEQQAQVRVTQPVARWSAAEKWLLASNVVGIGVAAALVLYFGVRMFTGVEVELALPDVSGFMGGQAGNLLPWSVTAGAVAFGAMFTPLGRWLRSEFT